MKALLAILITVCLLAATYVVSANIYFDLFWVQVLVTSIWAAIDSKKLELNRYRTDSFCRPFPFFCLCSLLWIIVFPYYLWIRFRIKGGTAILKRELPQSAGPCRRFFHRFWRMSERGAENLVIGIFALKVFLMLFCAEEAWRGPRVWANYRHELEAKGESFDWHTLTPPQVPDSQNFYSAPMMSTWFMRKSGGIKSSTVLSDRLNYSNTCPKILIAEVTFGAHAPAGQTNTLRFNDLESHRRARELTQNISGPSAFASRSDYSFTARRVNASQVQPLYIYLESEKRPSIKELIGFFGNNEDGPFLFQPSGTNSWHLYSWFCAAQDYLNWTDQFKSDLDLMRDAVTRPYARMDGDYRYPPTIPMPNFISYRTVAQTLAQRAQCQMLLGQPEKALQELALMNELRRKLEGGPSGKPVTLVAAMIDAAVADLYSYIIADGFRLHAWKEPQLATLQNQLNQIELTQPLKNAFHNEQVSISTIILQMAMARCEIPHMANASLTQKIKNLRPLNFLYGFLYFNTVEAVSMEQLLVDSIDTTNRIIVPSKIDEFYREEESLGHLRLWQPSFPYKWIAAVGVPNFANAAQTDVKDQTQINEAQIACALERHRLAHGSYPETLNEIVMADKLPRDIIGGQAYQYRRNPDGGFELRSAGWNGGFPQYSVVWDASGTVTRVDPTAQKGDWALR